MDASAADDPGMSEHKVCPECGSESLAAPGLELTDIV
jgi:hypothetical protein